MPPKATSSAASHAAGSLESLQAEIALQLSSTKALFEQFDTSTWNPQDIRVYESLVEERRQLEIDHHKLSTRDVALRGGQRKVTAADLGSPINSNFKFDGEYSTYRYHGENTCVLDQIKSCSHELCRRAISEGLSYLEYDTIVHYDLRMSAAKTIRMKEALRKQRDVQLSKDMKDTEAWKDKCMRKMGSFGKEASDAIVRAASEITGWKLSSNETEIRPDTPLEQVARALSRIRASILTPQQHLFGKTFHNRIKAPGSDQYPWKLPSAFIEYLSPIRIDHLEAALFALKKTLTLNAILYYETYQCLQGFLKDFRDLLQWIDLPNRKLFVGTTVAEALDDIKVALSMDDMKSTLPRPIQENNPREAPRSSLHKALKECLDLENRAQLQMWRIQDQCSVCGSNPDAGLAEVKRKCISQSPMPAVSQLAISRLEAMNREYCAVSVLLIKARNGISIEELVQASMDQVQKIAGGNWMQLVPTSRNLRSALSARRRDEKKGNINERAIKQLDEALVKIDKTINSLDTEYSEKFLKETYEAGIEARKCAEPLIARALQETTDLYLLPGTILEDFHEETRKPIAQYAKGITYKPLDSETTRKLWQDTIRKNMSRGISEAFRVFQSFHKFDMSGVDNILLRSLLCQSHLTTDLLFNNSDSLSLFFNQQYRCECCLASTFLRLLAALPNMSAMNPSTTDSILQELSMLPSTEKKIPAKWKSDLQTLCHTFLPIHGYITIETMHTSGRADVEQVTLSIVFLLALGILTVKDSKSAQYNLDFIFSFMDIIFQKPAYNPTTSCFEQIKVLLGNIVKHNIRCCELASCFETNAAMPTPISPMRSLHMVSKVNDVALRLPTGMNVVIHPNTGHKQSVASMLRKHKNALSDLIDTDIRIFSSLEKGNFLKYCAFQVKLLNGAAEQIQRGFDTSKFDWELVDLLWRTFMHIEQVDDHGDPSSLNIGMHNQCSIWELVDSQDKNRIRGFMDGYHHGYRTDADLSDLARSCTQYAIVNGKRDPVIAFRRRQEKLRRLAGTLPERLEEYFLQQGNALNKLVLERGTRLREIFCRLNYVYQSDPGFSRLSTRHFSEMLDVDVDQFVAFTSILRVEAAMNDGEETADLLDQASGALVDIAKQGKQIPDDNEDMKLVCEAACRAWTRNPQENMIFSDDEEDDGDDEEEKKEDDDDHSEFVAETIDESTFQGEEDNHEVACDNDPSFGKVAPLRVNSIKPALQIPEPCLMTQDTSDTYEDGIPSTTSKFPSADASNPSLYWRHLKSAIQSRPDDDTPLISADPNLATTQTKSNADADKDPNNTTTDKGDDLCSYNQPDEGEAKLSTSAAFNDVRISGVIFTSLTSENTSNTVPESPVTDASFESALSIQHSEVQDANQLKSAQKDDYNPRKDSLLYDKILAWKNSLSITKTVMNSEETVGVSSTLLPFQKLLQKAELAELQCDYMLKTLTRQQGETEDLHSSEMQQVLEDIENLSRRVTALAK